LVFAKLLGSEKISKSEVIMGRERRMELGGKRIRKEKQK
jgi:hypothetical protein